MLQIASQPDDADQHVCPTAASNCCLNQDENAATEFRREPVMQDDPQKRLLVSCGERVNAVLASSRQRIDFVG